LATIRVYKRNSTFVELPSLVEELSNIGLPDTLKKYYNEPGDILQFESDNHNKFFMFSMTGTWDEIIKLK
jgi:hypothetical protein